MSLKNYPYDFSDDHKELYDILMNNSNYFIFAMSEEKYNHIFKLRSVVDENTIVICDLMNYRKFLRTFEEFESECKKLDLKWIKPDKTVKLTKTI